MTQWLQLSTPAENQNSDPSTYIKWLTTACCNFGSRRSDTLFSSPSKLHKCAHIQPHNLKTKTKNYYVDTEVQFYLEFGIV